MRALDVGRHLNLLSAEALAAAQVLGAGIRSAAESQMLQEGASAIGIGFEIVRT
jgi:hypothetical protein